MKTKPRKLALWTQCFTDQHEKLTKPSEEKKRARKAQSATRRLEKAKKARIKARTPKRAFEEKEYAKKAREWLLRRENWVCKVGGGKLASQVHHIRGRRGKLLLDERFWLAVSAEGHEWIHRNPERARAIGFLCQPGEWNTMPKE